MPSLTRAKRGDTTAITPCEPKGGRRPEKVKEIVMRLLLITIHNYYFTLFIYLY